MPLSEKAAIVLFKSELFIPEYKKLTIFEHNLNSYAIGIENSEINVEFGELNIIKATNNRTISLLNSYFNLKNSTLSISSTLPYEADIVLDEFSKLLADTSTLNVSGRAIASIVNKGYTIFNNSSLNTLSGGNYGILVQSGAKLILKSYILSTNIGSTTPANRPLVGVLDDTTDGVTYVGGTGTSGGSVNIYANNCFYGPAFVFSEESRDIEPYRSKNEFTGVIPEVQLFASKLNASNWNCIKQ